MVRLLSIIEKVYLGIPLGISEPWSGDSETATGQPAARGRGHIQGEPCIMFDSIYFNTARPRKCQSPCDSCLNCPWPVEKCKGE